MAIKDRIINTRERVVEAFGGVTRRELDTLKHDMTAAASARAHEAYAQGYNDAGEDEPASGDIKKYGYRRSLTQGLRDFSQIDYENILEIVWTLWQSNPVADRHFEMKRDYIIGNGIAPKTDDPDLQARLDRFWSGNKMDRRAGEFTLQLFLFGCQCYPAFTREADGRVRLGYIDPVQIKDVIVHPENTMEMWAIVVKDQNDVPVWTGTRGTRVYRIIREDDDVVSVLCPYCYSYSGREDARCVSCGADLVSEPERVIPARRPGKLVTAGQATLEPWERKMLRTFGLDEYTGDCFYEKVNSVSNQPRGYSDLLQEADWLDQHDETLFALADREQMAGYFSWDVKLTGADDAKVKERAQELRCKPPAKGSVNVHNDAEEWQFNYPDLKQNATIETQNALLTNILGGLGWPRHFYGYGDETNRATAQAQHDPTWRSMEHDQDVVKSMLLRMLYFVRDQAEIAGAWKPGKNDQGEPNSCEIDLQMPEMTSKDIAAISTALGSLVLALAQAADANWITRVTAAKAMAKVLAEMDVEINPEEELKAAADQAAQADLGDAGSRNDWLSQHGDLTSGADAVAQLFAGVSGADAEATVR